MSKSMNTLGALAIAAALAAGFAACTSDDITSADEQTISVGEPQAGAVVYSVSIPANIGDEAQTRSGSATNVESNGWTEVTAEAFGRSDAKTRAVSPGTGDKEGYLVSTFRPTDDIFVYNKTQGCEAKDASNNNTYLHADAEASNANLTGALTFWVYGQGYKTVANDDVLQLVYNSPRSNVYYNTDKSIGTNVPQPGTLAGLSHWDFATAEVRVTGIVSGTNDATGYTLRTTKASFQNAQSMFKFTFTGLPNDAGVEKVNIHSAGGKLVSSYNYFSDDEVDGDITIDLKSATTCDGHAHRDVYRRNANGPGVVYAALRFLPLDDANATDDITFTVTDTDNKTYTVTKPSPKGGFQNGKYYTSTIVLNTDLADVNSDIVVLDGTILTGTLSGNHKISIADRATVTLNGVTINGSNNADYPWAGITCEGDATIILADGTTNTVKGFYNNAGISVPEGKTLTIQGTGTLIASSITGAGIGGGSNISCGNIVIKNGNITATGGGYSAGIGGGYARSSSITCGSITIEGGTVTANGGASGGPGIGTGAGDAEYRASCGVITISGGTVNASARGGNGAGIGCGNRSDCASISITGGVVTASGRGNAAGIGTCYRATCGTISVTGGTVTATRGNSSSNDIGRGSDDTSCGTITVSSNVKTSDGKSYYSGTNGYNHN